MPLFENKKRRSFNFYKTQLLLTVIIVTKDPGDDIYPTLSSLRHLDDPSVEILIKDNSSDKKLEKVNEIFHFTNFRYIHSPDKGVYDAMNQALDFANGEYIFFLNAGDQYVDCNLTDILQNFSSEYDYLYGDVLKLEPYAKIQRYTRFMNKYIIYLKAICHQGIITKKEVLKKLGGFDTNLEFNADHLLIIHLVKNYDGVKIQNLISIYQGGGLSSNFKLSKEKEEYFNEKISNCYNKFELTFLRIADSLKSVILKLNGRT